MPPQQLACHVQSSRLPQTLRSCPMWEGPQLPHLNRAQQEHCTAFLSYVGAPATFGWAATQPPQLLQHIQGRLPVPAHVPMTAVICPREAKAISVMLSHPKPLSWLQWSATPLSGPTELHRWSIPSAEPTCHFFCSARAKHEGRFRAG